MTTDQQLIIDTAVHRAQEDGDKITLRAFALLEERVKAEWVVAKEVEVARDENKRLVKQVEDYRTENTRLEKRIKELETGKRDKKGRFQKSANEQSKFEDEQFPPQEITRNFSMPNGWEWAPRGAVIKSEWKVTTGDSEIYPADGGATGHKNPHQSWFLWYAIRPIQKASK